MSECSSTDKDSLYLDSSLVTKVDVKMLTCELLGDISSDSVDSHELEYYLTSSIETPCSDSQEMAKTKQTARKGTEPGLSEGGMQLATLGSGGGQRKSPRRGANRTGFTSDEGESSNLSSRSKRSQNDPEDDPTGEPGEPQPQRRPGPKVTDKELVREWNKKARIGFTSETARGWLKKTVAKRGNQRRALRLARPGVKALREIKFYQRCQTFLIPVLPFQRLVREVCSDDKTCKKALRWQCIALFTLQSAAEAYMAGFFHDINLCALHRRVITIGSRDVWLAVQIRGREHVGGKPQVSDAGSVNTTDHFISADSEKAGVQHPYKKNDFAGEADWSEKFRTKATPRAVSVPAGRGKGRGKGKGKGGAKRIRILLRDNLHGITRPAICRLARRGGVRRISSAIYDEIRGCLRVFLEEVVRDIITYVDYAKRRTVTVTEVLFALKRHGRTLYGFTRPYNYSRKLIPPTGDGDNE